VAGAVVEFGDRRTVARGDGRYTLRVAPGTYPVTADGELVGQVIVTTPPFMGDLLVHANGCIAFYGAVLDADSGPGIQGARVRPAGSDEAITDTHGWYRVDAGCRPSLGNGTTYLSVTHPQYHAFGRTGPRAEWFRGLHRQDVTLTLR
jgi:hypothetical protein